MRRIVWNIYSRRAVRSIDCNSVLGEGILDEIRARRATVFILLILTIVVLLRAISTAQGATFGPRLADRTVDVPVAGPAADIVSLEIEEQNTLLEGGTRAHRTLIVRGLPATSSGVSVDWRLRRDESEIARGHHPLSNRSGGAARIILTLPLPDVRLPSGLYLDILVQETGRPIGRRTFPYTLYPASRARDLLALFEGSRIALLDPEGTAAPLLQGLGARPDLIERNEDLALYRGDLIVVGQGGFVRGREAIGPVLAARARGGMPVLVLDQPNLPGTLSEDLRLWPAFHHLPRTEVLVDTAHPIVRDVGLDRNYFTRLEGRSRPLLPPTRGNFRVLAELRVRSGPAWRQGVALLEFPIGDGTVIASQAAITALHDSDGRARILLVNALAYLLEDRPAPARAFLYAEDVDELPPCLTALDPRLARAPRDLSEVDVLIAPADWRAPRRRAEGMAPLALVARFLREGGTLVLINPQSLIQEHLRRLTGTAVQFRSGAVAQPKIAPESAALLRGVTEGDLLLLARAERSELRLLERPGDDGIRPVLLTPGLSMYKVGRGTLVALSLPDPDECRPSRVSSLLARLLTNLGVPLQHRPGVDPDAVTLLNE
ncbi:MAG: hypothetical protein V3U83_07830 [Acidobacteriota bacterium]